MSKWASKDPSFQAIFNKIKCFTKMKNSQAGVEKLGKTADFVGFLIFFHFNAPRSHVFESFSNR